MSRHELYEHRGIVEDLDVGGGVRILVYESGKYGVHHVCKTWPDDQEPDGVFVKVVAPGLGQHEVKPGPPLNVSPSILCKDCGLHGYVRDGVWVPA